MRISSLIVSEVLINVIMLIIKGNKKYIDWE